MKIRELVKKFLKLLKFDDRSMETTYQNSQKQLDIKLILVYIHIVALFKPI